RLDAPRDVRQWEVEMHELARELRGQLDNKIAILEHLIQEATQQADRLEAAVGRAEDLRTARDGERRAQPAAESGPQNSARVDGVHRAAHPASRRHAEIYSLADQGLS